jgi:hypothetical protein
VAKVTPRRPASEKKTEHVARIRAMAHKDLVRFWGRVSSETSSLDWPSWRAFEYLILRGFEVEGAIVRWPYEVGLPFDVQGARGFMEQIDGAIHFDGISVLVEAKNEEDSKGIEPICKLRNQLLRRPSGVIGAVFSRNGFTTPAKTLARFIAPQTILLWEGSEFAIALTKKRLCEGMRVKYRYAAEEAVPDYNLKLETW